jgi:hypothetical protein
MAIRGGDSVSTADLPYGGAYTAFPEGPEAYRDATWDATLKALFRTAVSHAQSRIDWYEKKAAERARSAKRIRWWALVLFAIGTLAPIVVTLLFGVAEIFGSRKVNEMNTIDYIARFPLAEVGYVLLALAGALVVFDQFFDSSGSWIRFRQSQARLEVLLADLRFAWAERMVKNGGALTDRAQSVELAALLREFVTKVELLAEEETKEWAQRFTERINAFDRNPNLTVKLGGDETPAGASAAAPRAAAAAAGATASGNGAANGATAAGNAARTPAASSASVNVRLAIDDAETLEDGSLGLTVNDVVVPVPPDGLAELPLEVGVRHHLVASGRRGGRGVRGELEIIPTPEDEDRPLALGLA